MKLSLCVAYALILLSGVSLHRVRAQEQQPSGTPTIKVTSALVFLDVTVLDKTGQPVVSGLTKDDFTVTEDKVPQTIVSFEVPEVHVRGAGPEDANPSGKTPATILVMDLLNSRWEDFSYIREEVERFLKAQPQRLASTTELLVVGNESLEMLQSFTRNKADLFEALQQFPGALPYKIKRSFAGERLVQSLVALQQIALQNKGVPRRKNIVWVGRGGPNVYLDRLALPEKLSGEFKQYVHSTTNVLVDARMGPVCDLSRQCDAIQRRASNYRCGDDPFAGDINFGIFANETGGKLFHGRNYIDKEIKESEQMGGQYYTLTYQPQNLEPDGKFRRVRVTLRNVNLRAVTKAGYYAPDAHAPVDQREQQMIKLADAVESTIPFDALDVSLSGVVRHPDSQTAEFTVRLKSKNLSFQPLDDRKSAAKLNVAGASLNQYGNIVASKTETVTLLAPASHPTHLPDVASQFPILLRVPRKTRRVRVILEAEDGGRMGSAELGRKVINAAPATETPRPALEPRPPASENTPLH